MTQDFARVFRKESGKVLVSGRKGKAVKHHVLQRRKKLGIVGFLTIGFFSCATAEPTPEPTPAPPPPAAPGYAGLPHPLGLQFADVLAIFQGAEAPPREGDEIQNCDGDYRILEKKTISRDELKQGILELVRKEPIRYHWCFYSKLLDLEAALRKNLLLDEKQKKVVEAYRFLAPLARAFHRAYGDSRYLRWAIFYYRRVSELAFYRSVEPSPALTEELVGIGKDDPMHGTPEQATSVLEKYGILIPDRLQPGQKADGKTGDVLPGDAYVDTGSGVQAAPAPEASSVPPPPEGEAARTPASDSSASSVYPVQDPH